MSEYEDTILDDWVSPFDGMHGNHPELKRDAIEDRRKVDGCHPVNSQLKKNKRRVREALGGVCTHCGEDKQALLCVHHVNLDGEQEREQFSHIPYWRHIWREVKSGSKRYALLCRTCHVKLHAD